MIRKNNFVLTKGGESSNDSKEAGANGVISVAPIGSTVNASGITRIVIQPLGGEGTASGLKAGSVNKSKLNQTLHSNGSGNRALNNTQKIGRAGQGGKGVKSNESLNSDVSLSQTRN